MKGSNPIIPPGAQFDGARRGRSNMRMAVVVVVLMHMALFAGILFNACKQKDEGEAQKETEQEMAGIVNRQPEPAALPEPVTPNPLSTLPDLPGAGFALPPLPSEGSAGVPPVPLPATPVVPLPVAPAPSIPSLSMPAPAVGGTEYVSREQLEAAMATTRRQAASDGAKRGMNMTLDRMQNSPRTRARVGIS